MGRYEFREGSSAKFWEAEVDGSTLKVRYGKQGTQGQSKEKTFASPEAALKEEAKLIKEKVGKGYVKTGDGAAPAAEVVASAAETVAPEPAAKAPKKRPAKAAPKAEPAPAVEPAVSCADAPAAEESGKLFDARPLPTRMRPEPPALSFEEAEALLQKDSVMPVALPLSTASADAIAKWCGRIEDKLYGDNYLRAAPIVVEWLVGDRGLLVAVQAINTFFIKTKNSRNWRWGAAWHDAMCVALRRAATRAPEADYNETLAWCLAQHQAPQSEEDWKKAAYFAFVLADDRPASHALQAPAVLQQAEAEGVDVGRVTFMTPLIADAPPSGRSKRADAYFSFYDSAISAAEIGATLMAVARANGAPAAPSLGWLVRGCQSRHRGEAAKALLETREPGVLAELLPFLHEEETRKVIEKAGAVYPAFILRECLAASEPDRMNPVLRGLFAAVVARYGPDKARQWAEGLDARAVSGLEAFLTVKAVPVETLPAMFRDPPWRRKKVKLANDIVLAVEPVAAPISCPDIEKLWEKEYARRNKWRLPVTDIENLPNFLAQAEKNIENRERLQPDAPPDGMSVEEALDWLERRLAAVYGEGDVWWTPYSNLFSELERLADPLALMLWEQTGPALKSNYVHWPRTVPMMLSRFGERAIPGLLKLIKADPITGLEVARPVDAPGIAPFAARAFVHPRLKKARALGADWLRSHRRTALTRLIPDAVGAPGEARDAAETVLRWFVKEDPKAAEELQEAAAAYARAEPRVGEAMEQVLSRDPLGEYPAKIAPLPSWVVPGALIRPQLREGGALPDEAMLALVEMLSFSTPNAVYAGVPMTRDLCTPRSLAAFGWDLFTMWLAVGAPAKEGWTLRALGWIGDDECARRLTPLIRRWPGESAHARAVTGLDVLADIGSDVALMNLNGIAEKLKFKGLQAKAKEKIASIAEARELTALELADRLAPDLDLDERGGLDLDFGPRKFRVGFDEFLKPWVKDADNKRLKELPKPNKSDDAGLGAAAVARWSALKKDARTAASLQLARLEAMLATSRRVRPDVFWTFFASHPLIRHLAQRLVWGLYDDGAASTKPSLIFRVNSDLTFSGSGDDPVELDVTPEAKGLFGLVHPLHMAQAESEAWGALFGDYEIMQPFLQLGRETYVLTDAEKEADKLGRFKGVEVESVRLRGMASRGWELGSPQDGGGIWWIARETALANGGTATASLSFHSGLIAGGSDYEDKTQTLDVVELYGAARGRLRFGELDGVAASEMLRGLTLLAEAGRT